MAQGSASDAEDRQVCLRCAGTGQYKNFGSCWRCDGSGIVSLSKIQAYFRSQPSKADAPKPLDPPILDKIQARAKAEAMGKALKAKGYTGLIKVLDQRIELLARTRSQPGKTLHMTWHPGGYDEEWLEGPPSKHWRHILAD